MPRAIRSVGVVGLALAGALAAAPLVFAETPATRPAASSSAALSASASASARAATAASAANSAAADVDESEPPPIPKPTKTVAGWRALWDEGVKGNLDLRVAVDELERAEAATRVAWGGVLPTATGVATIGYASTSNSLFATLPAGNSLSGELVVVAPLIHLRNAHAIGTARVGQDIARLSLVDVRRRFALSLSRALLSIAAARRIAEVNRIGLRAALVRLELTRARVGIGVVDARDLLRAQQDVASARAAIPSADEALRQAREGLALLFGQTGELDVAGDPASLQGELASFCGGANSGAPRADVAVAKRQIVLAERNVDDIALLFAPTLSAQLNVGTIGAPIAGPYASGWSVLGVLTIPLYDGGVRYGEKRDRVALVDESRARAVQVEVSVATETAQARRAIDVAMAAEHAAREARDLAQKIDDAQRGAYAVGASGTTNFDVIEAGRVLRQAEGLLVVRELELARARVSLPFVEGACAGVASP
jgi:outer membrane protein TolC